LTKNACGSLQTKNLIFWHFMSTAVNLPPTMMTLAAIKMRIMNEMKVVIGAVFYENERGRNYFCQREI
jgi:hypothetical protein